MHNQDAFEMTVGSDGCKTQPMYLGRVAYTYFDRFLAQLRKGTLTQAVVVNDSSNPLATTEHKFSGNQKSLPKAASSFSGLS